MPNYEVSLIQADVSEIMRRLERMKGPLYGERQRILSLAGAYIAASTEASAPMGRRTHHRYSTPKLLRSIRTPVGMGRIVATYKPGNLKRSMQVLRFRQAPSTVFIGAKLAKGNVRGVFGSRSRVDGYYAHMVERGTQHSAAQPFVLRGFNMGKSQALRTVESEVARVVNKYAQLNGFT